MNTTRKARTGVFVAVAVFALAAATAWADAPDQFSLQLAEFAKYHWQITGKNAPEGAVLFAIDPKVSKSGNDAYRIVTKGSGVAITGSNLRSVWYGLYDLLERRGGCHWFWDGDIVPKRDTIDLSNLDIREEARFEYRGLRYFAHRGACRQCRIRVHRGRVVRRLGRLGERYPIHGPDGFALSACARTPQTRRNLSANTNHSSRATSLRRRRGTTALTCPMRACPSRSTAATPRRHRGRFS